MSEWKTRRSREFRHLEKMAGAEYMIQEMGIKIKTRHGIEDGYRVLNEKSREVFYGSHEACRDWITKKSNK